MIRGVSFKISQKKDSTLWNILNCVNVRKYNWYSIQSQNEAWEYINDVQESPFLGKEMYDGKSFFDEIHKDHFIIFLKLQAYEGIPDSYDIHSYKEFQESPCKILLLIYDCEYVEIYDLSES